MNPASRILLEISEIMGLEKPLTVSSVRLTRKQLKNVLLNIGDFNGFVLDGSIKRPPMKKSSNGHPPYQRKMSDYLESRYGINIPPSSLISSPTFNKFADWADGYRCSIFIPPGKSMAWSYSPSGLV